MAEVPAAVLARYSRFPEQASAHGPEDEFLRLACLNYSDDDDPARWAAALEILRASPGIVEGNACVAAAAADARYFGQDAIADLLTPLTA